MKHIKIQNKEIEVRTSLNEIQIPEFEQLMIINKKIYEIGIDRYIEILEILSNLSKDEIEELDLQDFELLVKSLDIEELFKPNTEFINRIELDGILYTTKATDTFKFSVKEIIKLQEVMNKNPDTYLLDLVAIIFRSVDGDLSDESINKRKVIFKGITMDIVTPYLVVLSEYFLSKLNA